MFPIFNGMIWIEEAVDIPIGKHPALWIGGALRTNPISILLDLGLELLPKTDTSVLTIGKRLSWTGKLACLMLFGLNMITSG